MKGTTQDCLRVAFPNEVRGRLGWGAGAALFLPLQQQLPGHLIHSSLTSPRWAKPLMLPTGK